jgi:hypothetical protein
MENNMSNYSREEVEILRWLKHYPNDLKTVPEFHEMFKSFASKELKDFQNVFNMLENEGLIYGGTTNKGDKTYQIAKEGLIALRSVPVLF